LQPQEAIVLERIPLGLPSPLPLTDLPWESQSLRDALVTRSFSLGLQSVELHPPIYTH
jgi:hypothetical protein